MRISVVLASYNGEKYIEEQLESLRLQTCQPDEVIIRDDCSTDATYSLCRSFIQEHSLSWTLLRVPQNGGYRRNFREAIAMASGDWVLLCDQDDVWCSNKVEAFAEITTNQPDACAIACSFSCIDANGAPMALAQTKGANHGLLPFSLPIGTSKLPLEQHPNLFFVQNIAMGCCAAFRKDVCDRYLRLSQCAFPHDWELMLFASLQGDIYFTSAELIKYRLHGNNAIGLPALTGDVARKRPSMEGRMRFMNDFDGLLAAAERALADLGKQSLPKRLYDYSKARRKALETHSPFKWLALYRYADIYTEMFSQKQRLGDLYCILKR